MKDAVEGFGGVAVIKCKEVREMHSLIEGNDVQEGVECEGWG